MNRTISCRVILTFKNRALAALWNEDDASKIAADMVPRLLTRLDALDQATKPADMNIPGFNFHKLRGKPVRYSVHVNGPWCVTFEWDGEHATRVDFEQYH